MCTAEATILVDDGSGAVRVQAYREIAQALSEQKRIPREGELVDVSGSLMVSAEEDPKLRLQAAEHLRLVNAQGG